MILFRQLASYLAMPVFLVDPVGNLVFYNESAERILGLRYEETGEMPVDEWSTVFVPCDESGEPLPPEALPLVQTMPGAARWTSGFDLASAADVVIHDAQYSEAEYDTRVGWGHSTIEHAVAFARHVEARRLVAFHHDPAHDDAWIRDRYGALDAGDVVVDVAREGLELTL